jgi:type I restriction enzyme M protein
MANNTESGKQSPRWGQKPNAKASPESHFGAKASSESPKGGNGLEQTLWLAADKLRKNIDAAEYKHIVLGLIFLKYISDSFETLHNKLIAGQGEYKGADPEDVNEYKFENVFFVPLNAHGFQSTMI